MIEILKTLADEPYRIFAQKLHPNITKILGVRLPKLRTLAKQLAREKGLKALTDITGDSFEERLLYGMIIGYVKGGDKWSVLPHFINRINAWGVCDSGVSTLRFLGQDKSKTLAFLEQYINSDKPYDQRFVAVVLKTYFTHPDDWISSINIYQRLTHPDYYVRMAISWGLAEWAVTKPNEVLAVLPTFHPDIQLKTKQKMRESTRIVSDIKKALSDNAAGNHG